MAKQSFTKQKDKRWLLPRLVNKYKETTLLEKVAGFGSIILLFAMLTLNGGGNVLWVALGLASIVLIINLLIYKSRMVFAGMVLALHVSFIPYVAGLYSLMTEGASAGEISLLVLAISAATFLLSILAYRFGRGRYWLTLLYVFITLDLAGVLLSSTLNLRLGIVTGVVLSLAVIAFRAINWRTVFRKPDDYLSRKLVDSSQNDVTAKYMKKLGFQVKPLKDTWPLGQVAYSSEGIFLIATLTPSHVIAVNKNRFFYDGAFIEPLLHRIAEEGKKWTEANHVDAKYVTTVALINNEAYYPTSDDMLSISIKEKGSREIMGIYLTTQKGIKTIMDKDPVFVPRKVLDTVNKEKNIELPV